jgi:hypothetical protein
MMTATVLWINIPLMVLAFGLWTGIPLWLVLRHPDRHPAETRALPAYRASAGYRFASGRKPKAHRARPVVGYPLGLTSR